MKRWQLELMGVMLLTPAVVFLIGNRGLLWVPVLWLAGRATIARAVTDPPFKAGARFLVASFAAVGCLMAVQVLRVLRFRSSMPGLLADVGAYSFIAFAGLLLYRLERVYARLVSPRNQTRMPCGHEAR